MLVTNGYDIKIGANGKIDNVEGEITLEKSEVNKNAQHPHSLQPILPK